MWDWFSSSTKSLVSTPHLCSRITRINHLCSVVKLLCFSYMAPAEGTVQQKEYSKS
jgi:hypothetical protein